MILAPILASIWSHVGTILGTKILLKNDEKHDAQDTKKKPGLTNEREARSCIANYGTRENN